MKNSLINLFFKFWLLNKASFHSGLSNKLTILTYWFTDNWSNFWRGTTLFPVLSFKISEKSKKTALNLRSFLAGFGLILKILIPDLCFMIYLYWYFVMIKQNNKILWSVLVIFSLHIKDVFEISFKKHIEVIIGPIHLSWI